MKQKVLWIIILAFHLAKGCDDEIPNASECNRRGSLVCGECYCKSPYFGHHCELDASVAFDSDDACMEFPDGPVCNGRGHCVSGFCECDHRYNTEEVISGQFCECTNFLCNRHNGLLCSGPDHGKCECNECVCKPGWTGSDCACQDSYDECMSPISGEICSNHGNCVCNKCHCAETYYGKWCDECMTCETHCETIKDCVYCHSFGGRSCRLSSQQLKECKVNIKKVPSLDGMNHRLCRYFDEDGCSYSFAFHHSPQGVVAYVKNKLACPPTYSIPDHSFMLKEGRNYCFQDFEVILSSEHITKTNMSWTFDPRIFDRIDVFCPYIKIKPNLNCDDDMLLISEEDSYKTTQRICKDIRNYRFTADKSVKITFWKTESSSAEFACRINCVDLYHSTTPSPKYTCPADPPRTPIPVTTCDDMEGDLAGPCQCYDCQDGHISLHCSICEDCDMNIFASFDFRTDVELEIKVTCIRHLNLSGFFRHNSDKIKYVKLCVEDEFDFFPYSELVNLEALAYHDCRSSKYGLCQIRISTTESEKLPNDTHRVPLMMASEKERTFEGTKMTLPKPEEVPRLVQLSMVMVRLMLSQRLLNFQRLRELLIDSDTVSVEANTFVALPNLQLLVVNSCQKNLGSKSFKLTTRNLKYLTIQNHCLQSLAPDAIIIETTDEDGGARSESNELKVSVSVPEAFYDHIPMCPFRILLDMNFVRINWLTRLNCRSCGGIWHWELTDDQNTRLEASCTDPVSGSQLAIKDYTANNDKICHFLTGYPDSCA